MIERDVGKRIQELRKSKKMTQAELAERLGLSTNHMSALERGQYNIKLELLVLIMNELECTADDLFCDSIKYGYKVKASRLSDQIEKLPQDEQDRLLELVEMYIKTSRKK